jgi:hypothetical protein
MTKECNLFFKVTIYDRQVRQRKKPESIANTGTAALAIPSFIDDWMTKFKVSKLL